MIDIIIDSREQAPYLFQQYQAKISIGTLQTGDYSIPGFTDSVAIERKELGDLIGCLTHDRERFTRELERLRGYQAAAIVVEAPFAAIAGGNYRSRMQPESAVQSVISIIEKYRLPMFFAESRQAGEYFAYHFLRHFTRHAQERFKAIQGATPGGGARG